MLIWRGLGILVPVTGAIIAVPCALLGVTLAGNDAGTAIGLSVGLLLAAVAVFVAGQKLNAPRRGFHPATGQPVLYRNAHTFFFVPMQY